MESKCEICETSSPVAGQPQRTTVQEGLSLLALAAALEESPQAMLIFDAELRVMHATSLTCSLLKVQNRGSENPGLLRFLSLSALDPPSLALAQELILSTSDQNHGTGETILKIQDGSSIRMRTRNLAPGYRAVYFDEIREDLGSVHAESVISRDSLTGLLTRALFESALHNALQRTADTPIAVLLLDLDRFKAVNDTLGHGAGDLVLRRVAERLLSAVRKSDRVARFGGDEFTILIDPSPSRDEPKMIAQRILDLVQRTYLIEGQIVNIGVSIGIAQSPEHGLDGKTLLRNADLALYQSKASGRATYHFFEISMEQRASQRRTNELELRKALALRQLEVHYQPQVDTPTGRLVGFEALLRWRHPERGLIPPGLFLPLAEEIGVIVPIGDWVLRTSCREAMKWPGELTIAVNASPLQFDTGTFAASVRRALDITGLPGERLEIEITEGILLRNSDAVLDTLHQLRDMKVRIAMDDFGTGYASLSQLSRFPFDKIKIDRSLAGFQGDDMKQRAIVRAITALGQSLGVCTLAEGVENEEQLTRLAMDGCASVQGFFLGKPVPADKLEEIILRLCPPLNT